MKHNRYLALLLPMMLLVSCGEASSGNSDSSSAAPVAPGLKGVFRGSASKTVYVRDDVAEGDFVYATTWPLNQITYYGKYEERSAEEIAAGQNGFDYKWDLKLALKKDWSYQYVYSVIFANPSVGKEMLSIDVDVHGTYTMEKTGESDYTVSLSAPNSGTESYFGCVLSMDELFWFGGGITQKHATPDKQIDFALMKEIGQEEVDWFVRSRDVKIHVDGESPMNNTVSEDLFDPYFLDHVGKYVTY